MNQKKILGRYIISDPKVCHGKLTFKNTRIFVDDVLEMVAEGFSWKYIEDQWQGAISKEAIKEAVLLSKDSLKLHSKELIYTK